MTQNGNLKRRVRARAAKTGESYTAALRHIRQASPDHPDTKSVQLAVAQTSLFNDPRDISGLRACGMEMRGLMRDAHKVGARLIHFPEGTTCSPNKRVMSEDGPRAIGPSDWARVEWAVLREELDATRKLAKELKLWTVSGSVHQLTPPHRPHNSLYVVSDRGELVTRYDERMLSNTKISFMYSPGKVPVTFDVDGVCFGCALGMEAHYPEIFTEYERLDADASCFRPQVRRLRRASFRSRGIGARCKQYVLGQLFRPRAAERGRPFGNRCTRWSVGSTVFGRRRTRYCYSGHYY